MILIVKLMTYANKMLFTDENEDDLNAAPPTSGSAAAPSMPLLNEEVEPDLSGNTTTTPSFSGVAPSMPLLDEAKEPGPSGITRRHEDMEPGPSDTTGGNCVEDDTSSGEAV